MCFYDLYRVFITLIIYLLYINIKTTWPLCSAEMKAMDLDQSLPQWIWFKPLLVDISHFWHEDVPWLGRVCNQNCSRKCCIQWLGSTLKTLRLKNAWFKLGVFIILKNTGKTSITESDAVWYVVWQVSISSTHGTETESGDEDNEDDDVDYAQTRPNYMFFTNKLKSQPDG